MENKIEEFDRIKDVFTINCPICGRKNTPDELMATRTPQGITYRATFECRSRIDDIKLCQTQYLVEIYGDTAKQFVKSREILYSSAMDLKSSG